MKNSWIYDTIVNEGEKVVKIFCQRYDLLLDNVTAEYDFDSPIDKPIYYDRVLNNWNILNTIATPKI